MNSELHRLYEEDQADRIRATGGAGLQLESLMERDRARRARADELLRNGEARDSIDYYHAGMIFQHGEALEDYARARTLALKSAELGHQPARWLAAAAHDRRLMQQGKPQKYGTQFFSDGTRWRAWKIADGTTEAERAEWHVPPVEETERLMNKHYGPPPPPDPRSHPEWLQDALQDGASDHEPA